VTQLSLLYQGQGVVAVDKPAGVLVIPGRGEQEAPPVRVLIEQQLGRPVFVVHRLDRDTSGVLLFALDAPIHRVLSMAFEAGLIEKRYLAVVQGELTAPLELTRPLAAARRGRMRVARPGEDSKNAHTLVRPVEALPAATLVEATPLTGRTHQIRVHLADAGHPLLFDHQYGRAEPWTARALGGEGEETVLARTPLHAARVTLPALEGIAPITIEAPIPADLARTLELLRQAGAPKP
jgi:tRNA pseudouridine32 synthase/23S rRNA pseudouridine746 synthase/23S rRNA pseudouridine955/2504/2580 synthase